jgi:pimeloyl-ACP methyl ester carboxylesterase
LPDDAEMGYCERWNRALLGAALLLGARPVLGAAPVLAPRGGAHTSITAQELARFDDAKQSRALKSGVKLAYVELGARDAPPVVLIHGYTDSARDWAPLAPLLEKHFRLIIVDLRGHGASSKPECCYSRFDFAYDVKLLLDDLNIPRAAIVGHSLGSLVAQAFAEVWPASTRRLVLISSTGTSFGEDSPGRMPPWLEEVERLEDPIDADSRFMKDWWHISMSVNPEFFARRQRQDAAAIPAAVWKGIADQTLTENVADLLPRIEAPTLLLWGGHDTLASGHGRAALEHGIAGSQATVFGSLGHDLIWEDPALIANRLTDFLAKP